MAAQDNTRRVFRGTGQGNDTTAQRREPRVDDRRVGALKHRPPFRLDPNGHCPVQGSRDSPTLHSPSRTRERHRTKCQPVNASPRGTDPGTPSRKGAAQALWTYQCRDGMLTSWQPDDPHSQRTGPNRTPRRARCEHGEEREKTQRSQPELPAHARTTPSINAPATHSAMQGYTNPAGGRRPHASRDSSGLRERAFPRGTRRTAAICAASAVPRSFHLCCARARLPCRGG